MTQTKLCLLASAVLLQGAPAATISMLSSPHDGYTDATWNQWVGQAFLVAAAQATVSSASLPLVITGPNENFVVRIVGSLSSNPNAPDLANTRATLHNPNAYVQAVAVQTLTFTPKAGQPLLPLDADTRYWLVIGSTAADFNQTNSAGLVRWSYTNTNAPAPDPGQAAAILNSVAESGSAGAGWTVLAQSPQRLGLELIPVPEPGSAALALATLGLRLRRRRH